MAFVRMIGVRVGVNAAGRIEVMECVQETPAAYCGSLAIGDVVECVDGEACATMEMFLAACDGREGTLVSLDVRPSGWGAAESIHLLRQACGHLDPGAFADEDPPSAGMGARVRPPIPSRPLTAARAPRRADPRPPAAGGPRPARDEGRHALRRCRPARTAAVAAPRRVPRCHGGSHRTSESVPDLYGVKDAACPISTG
jgi:hypothetical protein